MPRTAASSASWTEPDSGEPATCVDIGPTIAGAQAGPPGRCAHGMGPDVTRLCARVTLDAVGSWLSPNPHQTPATCSCRRDTARPARDRSLAGLSASDRGSDRDRTSHRCASDGPERRRPSHPQAAGRAVPSSRGPGAVPRRDRRSRSWSMRARAFGHPIDIPRLARRPVRGDPRGRRGRGRRPRGHGLARARPTRTPGPREHVDPGLGRVAAPGPRRPELTSARMHDEWSALDARPGARAIRPMTDGPHR